MRAALVRELGPPEVISIEQRPAPVPGPHEVLARVLAAGVNFADLLMVAGRYQVKPSLPFVPGLEFCGIVSEVGTQVTRWRPGDRILGAPLTAGCFAEQVVAQADQIFRAPQDLPDELAAQFLIAHGTAAFAFERARLASGETLLVTGAGGGVGLAAVAVAARLGARVIAAAGSPEKLAAARAAGASELIDYSSEPLGSALKRLSGGRGAHVVLDTLGGALFDESLHGTARRGRVLVVGFASGAIPRIAAEYLLVKNLTVIGIGFGGMLATDPAGVERVLEGLFALHAKQPFVAAVAGRYPLEQTAVALRRLAERAVVGKQLIVPQA